MLFAVDFDDYKNECGKNYSSVNFSPLGVIINKEILNDDWSVCMSQTINRKKMNTNSTLKSAQFKVGKYPVTLPKENPTFVGKNYIFFIKKIKPKCLKITQGLKYVKLLKIIINFLLMQMIVEFFINAIICKPTNENVHRILLSIIKSTFVTLKSMLKIANK